MSSNDIRSILNRIDMVEGELTPTSVKHGLNSQQKKAGQLPALFKPKNISPTLTKKPYQKHPMDGKLVGDSIEPKKNALEEAMQDIEEDMVSKVKQRFADYLEQLEQDNHLDSHLVRKAKNDLDIANDPENEDVEEATWDQDVAPVSDPGDTEVAHGLENDVATAVSQPSAPLGESPAKVYEMDDGACLECWGDDDNGYELRFGDRALPSRFPKVDHADMAVKLFQKRRREAQHNSDQDYIQEK